VPGLQDQPAGDLYLVSLVQVSHSDSPAGWRTVVKVSDRERQVEVDKPALQSGLSRLA